MLVLRLWGPIPHFLKGVPCIPFLGRAEGPKINLSCNLRLVLQLFTFTFNVHDMLGCRGQWVVIWVSNQRCGTRVQKNLQPLIPQLSVA